MDRGVLIELSDYRCFARSSPCRIEIRRGFTALVGPNNSGKSSFLRSFYELRSLFATLRQPAVPAVGGRIVELLRGQPVPVAIEEVHDQAEVFFGDEAQELVVKLTFLREPAERVVSAVTLTFDRLQQWKMTAAWHGEAPANSWPGQVTGTAVVNGHPSETPWDCAPLFDWADAFANSMYVGPNRDLAHQLSGNYFDLSIGSEFVTNWHRWKTGRDRAAQASARRVVEDIRTIFGLARLDIDSNPGDGTIQVTTERGTRKLTEVGAGLAQFIVVFGCAAMKRPRFILIDEPEVHLHPSLQATFVTRLASYATEGIIFATHSIGLARTIADRIYALRVDAAGRSEVRELGKLKNLAEFLGEMSFSAYQELGFERLLLVEGPSEVRALQQWLRLYGKDHRVVVMNLGGSGLIRADATHELSELKRITATVSVLIDSERTAEGDPIHPDRERFVDDCKALGFDVCVTQRRATENYFPERAIRSAKRSEKYAALGAFEKLEHCALPWSKMADNWRIAADMRKEDLAGTDVGAFLERL